MTPGVLRVTAADLELFAAASGDRNPVHVSPEYARRTPFGEPVVFGALAALAAFAHLPKQRERRLESVRLEFRGPLAVGASYGVELDGGQLRILDLGEPLLTADVHLSVVKKLCADIRARAVGEKVTEQVRPWKLYLALGFLNFDCADGLIQVETAGWPSKGPKRALALATSRAMISLT